jgi:hypothetical protein
MSFVLEFLEPGFGPGLCMRWKQSRDMSRLQFALLKMLLSVYYLVLSVNGWSGRPNTAILEKIEY